MTCQTIVRGVLRLVTIDAEAHVEIDDALRHRLPGFHIGVKIDEQLCNIARDLAADLDIDDRVERARCRYRLSNRSPRDLRRLEFRSGGISAAA